MAQDLNKHVNYFLSIGYPGAVREETFTFRELEIGENWTDSEVASFLDEDQRQWADNYVDAGWSFE